MDNINNRLLYTDLLRIVAVFGAILIHVSASNFHQAPLGSLTFLSFNVYDSFGRFCVPIFVMLSGMFFLNPNKEITLQRIFLKYIPRIILALVFFGTAYFVLVSYLETGIKDPNYIKKALIGIMSGNARYHLWYLYMIIGLYMITPILRIYISKATKKEIEYFLLLFVIFSGILYPLEKFTAFDGLANLVAQMKLSLFYSYIGYYLLGYYLHTFPLSKGKTQLLYLLGFLSFPFTIGITQLLSLWSNAPDFTFYSYFSFNIILMSSAIFLFFKNSFSNIPVSQKVVRFITLTSKNTFTMYLIHDFFLIIFSEMNMSTLTFSPVISPLILAVSIFFISLITSFILNYIWKTILSLLNKAG